MLDEWDETGRTVNAPIFAPGHWPLIANRPER